MEGWWAAGQAWGGPRSEGHRRGPLGHGGKSLYGENVVSDCNLAVYFIIGGQLHYGVACLCCTRGRSAVSACVCPPCLHVPPSRSSRSPGLGLCAVSVCHSLPVYTWQRVHVHAAFSFVPLSPPCTVSVSPFFTLDCD